MLIPRLFVPRKKGHYIRILLLIPVVWILTIIVYSYNDWITYKFNRQQLESLFEPVLPARYNKRHQSTVEEKTTQTIVKVKTDKLRVKMNTNHMKIEEKTSLNTPQVTKQTKREQQNAVVIPPPKETVPSGYGEMGKAVILTNISSIMQIKIDKGYKDNAFNEYVSDLISLDRSLPDVRPPECRLLTYPSKLPQTSVIIIFHNEAYSALLRTVKSVLNRSPPHLLKEIILVDDFSDREYLGKPLDDYVKTLGKVKIVRAKKREGLIRARLLGGAAATGAVLTYLDSHCECTEGWLEPMLDRIARDPTTVVCPIIDSIDDKTFEYHYNPEGKSFFIGGFDWNLQYDWHGIPEREYKRRNHSTDPIYSPTMAGGLFAIDKAFFEKLGTYDNGFDIWGSENLEISFKTWMCGGTLEFVPCSHVGHLYRPQSPYKWPTGGVDVLKRNSIRLAEVWMDEYKKYYYQRFNISENNLGDIGDISSRKALRKHLGCKTFKWFIDNVYPELFIPDQSIAWGEIRNLGTNTSTYMCIDSPAVKDNWEKPVGLYPCHKHGGNQHWFYSKMGEIRRDETCLDSNGEHVILYRCHGNKGNQYWIYDNVSQQIKNEGKCLQMTADRDRLIINECSLIGALTQRWKFGVYDTSKALIN